MGKKWNPVTRSTGTARSVSRPGKPRRSIVLLLGLMLTACSGRPAFAFDPLSGDYARDEPLDVRIVTYNHHGDFIEDPSRDAAFNRILIALDPDIICFQEFGEAVSESDVANRLDSILPVSGGSWQIHFGLLGYIRTVIASRYPLSMTRTDTIPASSTRGVTLALADLPDADYPVDVYLLGVHLKCCGDAGGPEDESRQDSADAIANWLGDARGVSRPSGDNVALPADTPMISLGDFNMVGGPQPENTLLTGDIQDEGAYGSDVKGDWDVSDMTNLGPVDPFTGDDFTWQGSASFDPSALDRIIFTDSVVTVANSFILNTDTMTAGALAAAGLQAGDTLPENSSDHLPVAVDLRLGDSSCTSDPECDDGLFCNGAETCGTSGVCQPGSDPCQPEEYCNEATDTCDAGPPPEVEILGTWNSGVSHAAPSGSTRALLFFGFTEDNNADMNLTSVAYGGQSMTKVIDANEGTGYRSYGVAYILDEDGIAAASGGDFAVTWAQTPSRDPAFCSVFLGNVDQDNPTAAQDSNGNTSSPIQTGPLATNSGDMVIVSGSVGDTGTFTTENGFSKGVEVAPESADGVAGDKPATGVDETPKLSHTSVNRQVILGFVVQTAGGECQSNGDCDDGEYCNGAETCVGSACQAGTAVDCNDGVGCTDDACNEGTDTCDNVPNDTLCGDGLYCNGAETCDALLDCEDGSDPCGADAWCDEGDDVCILLGTGDFEPDDDVDLVDFAAFQRCFGGFASAECYAANMVGGDGMIDLQDFAEFVTAFSGP